MRVIVNALLYMVRTGCQRRNLPPCYPPWRAVNYYFERWKRAGLFQQINDALNELDRRRDGREALPSLMCVELSPMIFEHRGTDAHKKINGRKPQLLVDTGGRIWRVQAHAACDHDGAAACALIEACSAIGHRLRKILGDGAYAKTFALKAAKAGYGFERASKPETAKGFVPIAKRWVVERTIAWTNFFRRIVKDYEHTLSSAESWVLLANTTLMLQRLLIKKHP